MEAVVQYLEAVDPERAVKAKQRYSCFDKCGSAPRLPRPPDAFLGGSLATRAPLARTHGWRDKRRGPQINMS